MDIPHIPGLDFDPTGDQLLNPYLMQRNLDYFRSGDPSYSENRHLIPDIELYQWDPEGLPSQYERMSGSRSNGRRQWFFFCRRLEKYRNSSRSERTVPGVGYWKITSSDKKVMTSGGDEEIGKKKNLTFYRGRTPNGIKTDWGMHEYHQNPSSLGYDPNQEMPYVVCHVFRRNGRRGDTDGANESGLQEDNSSSYPATAASENRAPTYQHGASWNQEEGMWGSLPEIQQLPPRDFPDYSSFTGGAESYSYAAGYGGLSDDNGFNNAAASPGSETYYYYRQY